MILEVTEETLVQAAEIHSESWQESHKSFCSPEFVAKHTVAAQMDHLRREMDAGKRLYLLADGEPVGIVSVWGSLIENLYVRPEKQGQGYGTRLLKFAIEQCDGVPTLWILSNNGKTRRMYTRHGFAETGCRKQLKGELWEVEMAWSRLGEIRSAEKASHEQAYGEYGLFEQGSWLAKPVKTVLDLLPLFAGREDFRALDLGCGVGRNCIPVAQAFPGGVVDCVDILDSAIEKLRANAERYGVSRAIRGMVSAIDDYEIVEGAYDLLLAVSALEHMDSRESFGRKLTEIRKGIRPGGVVCLVVNTGVRETDKATGQGASPQFEVNLTREELLDLLGETFAGWKVLKKTTVHQKYDIPRAFGTAELETDVVTWVAQRK